MLGARVGGFYEHTGWYLPVHPNLMRVALDHLETHAPFDARNAVGLVGPASAHWPWIVEGVLASPSMATRRAILEKPSSAWSEHAAVSTLLPVIEGHVADRSGRVQGIRVRERLDDLMYNEPASSMKTLASVSALEILRSEVFGSLEFGDPSQPADAVNRHWVLHGRTLAFGTPINACRTFMLVVALAELFDGAVALRASRLVLTPRSRRPAGRVRAARSVASGSSTTARDDQSRLTAARVERRLPAAAR